MWCLAPGECSRESPQKPPGDQRGEHHGGELSHVAGVNTIQHVIGDAAVVTGVEDLVQNADRQHAVGCGTEKRHRS